MTGHYALVHNGKFVEWGWAEGCGIKLAEEAIEISPELYSLLNVCQGDLNLLQEKVDELKKIVSYDPSRDIAIGDEVKVELNDTTIKNTTKVVDIFSDKNGDYETITMC